MSETQFLQADPKYRELSKAVQQFAESGTPEEQKALAYYFEYALREKLDLELTPDTTIEKGIQDTLTYSRLEEIRLTAINFVDRFYGSSVKWINCLSLNQSQTANGNITEMRTAQILMTSNGGSA